MVGATANGSLALRYDEGRASRAPRSDGARLLGEAPSFPCFMALYARAFTGAPPPLAAYVLAMSFRWFPLSLVFPHLGAIPSTYAAAEDALGKGVPIALCPGGLHEALTPFWKTDRADFGGHKGFLRIARKAWVPVVPMGIRGTAAPMLFKSRLLANLFVWPRLSGLNSFAISVLGVLGTRDDDEALGTVESAITRQLQRDVATS